MLIKGRIQRHEDIIHIVSATLVDRSDWLRLLSEEGATMKIPIANADEVLRPDPGSARSSTHPRWDRTSSPHHPRQQRVIPKSRDFH